MTSNRFTSILLLITVVSLLFAIPGVNAFWWYGEDAEEVVNNPNILYFPWKGEDLLPDEEEEGETSQLNGLQAILDALNNKGLSGESKLNQYIKKRVQNFIKLEYGSVDVKQSVPALLNDVADVNPNFEFILEGIIAGSGKNKYVEYFYVYMIDKPQFDAAMQAWDDSGLSESNYARDPSIFTEYFEPVNRVLIEKDAYGQWHAVIAEVGYCAYGYYEGSNNGGGQKVWTFDADSWQPLATTSILEQD